jgi:hypothetical protein
VSVVPSSELPTRRYEPHRKQPNPHVARAALTLLLTARNATGEIMKQSSMGLLVLCLASSSRLALADSWSDAMADLDGKTKALNESCGSRIKVIVDRRSFDTVLKRNFQDEWKSPVPTDPNAYVGVVLNGITKACGNGHRTTDDVDHYVGPAVAKLKTTPTRGSPSTCDVAPSCQSSTIQLRDTMIRAPRLENR